MIRRLGILALLLLVGGCESPPTQILVVVDAQPLVRARARGLRVRIWGRSRDEGDFPVGTVLDRMDFVSPNDWPRRFAIAPFERDASRLWRFEAAGLEESGREFVVTRVISGYQRSETLQVVMVLSDSCIDVPCEDPNTTCDPASPPDCVDANRQVDDLPPFMDGGYDASGIGDRCADDSECDDGLECTVDECVSGLCSHASSDALCEAVGCAAGRCVAGTCTLEPMDANCDDGLACTDDRCEMDGSCTPVPDDSLCTDGTNGVCDPTNGCQYDNCTPANCQPTGCRDAMCDAMDTCVRTSRCGGATPMCCGDVCVAMGCDDGNPCTDDRCDVMTMACSNDASPLEGMTCEDGDPCTLGTQCTGGTCAGGLDCEMQTGECQTGSCAGSACSFADVADGTSCTTAGPCGLCQGGSCVPCPDAGAPMMDGGPGVDSGPPLMDSGVDSGVGIDSGPPLMDSGVDSGSGFDSGPPPMDGGDGGDFCGGCPFDCCNGACCDLAAGFECCDTICCDNFTGFFCTAPGTCTFMMESGVPDGGTMMPLDGS